LYGDPLFFNLFRERLVVLSASLFASR